MQAAELAIMRGASKVSQLQGSNALHTPFVQSAHQAFEQVAYRIQRLQLAWFGLLRVSLLSTLESMFAWLRQALAGAEWQKPRIPVFSNATGEAMRSIEDIKKNIPLQLSKPVR